MFFRQLHMQVFIRKDSHVQEHSSFTDALQDAEMWSTYSSCHKTKEFLNHRYSCVFKNMPIWKEENILGKQMFISLFTRIQQSFISVPIKCCCKYNDLTCTKWFLTLNLLYMCYIFMRNEQLLLLLSISRICGFSLLNIR